MAKREFQEPALQRYDGRRAYWYIRYRVRILGPEGQIRRKEVWHKLGFCSVMKKRAALRERSRVLETVNNQIYTVRDQIRLMDFARLFEQQHLSTMAPGGQKQQLSLLKCHVLPALGEKRLCDLGTMEIQSFLNRKLSDGLAWWTRRALKALLSSIFTKATDWGYWDKRNPVTRIRLGKKRAKFEKRLLDEEQFRCLVERLPAPVGLMVETAVSTGMRISEILGLRWRSVDFARGLVRVEERYYRGDVGEPKSNQSIRSLPLGELLEDYRRLQPAGASRDAFVFADTGKPLDDRELLREVIRPVAKELGMYFPGFGWHTFRRMHLTLVQEEGATTFEAMAQAGHSRPSMTGQYTVVGLERREQAVARLQRRLLGRHGTRVETDVRDNARNCSAKNRPSS